MWLYHSHVELRSRPLRVQGAASRGRRPLSQLWCFPARCPPTSNAIFCCWSSSCQIWLHLAKTLITEVIIYPPEARQEVASTDVRSFIKQGLAHIHIPTMSFSTYIIGSVTFWSLSIIDGYYVSNCSEAIKISASGPHTACLCIITAAIMSYAIKVYAPLMKRNLLDVSIGSFFKATAADAQTLVRPVFLQKTVFFYLY